MFKHTIVPFDAPPSPPARILEWRLANHSHGFGIILEARPQGSETWISVLSVGSAGTINRWYLGPSDRAALGLPVNSVCTIKDNTADR